MIEMEYKEDFSPTLGALGAALAKAQGAMTGAAKGAVNPHFKTRYADLESTWDAIRIPLSSNGLAAVQHHRPSHDGVLVVTMLIHSSGEWIRGELWMPIVKADPQGFGSATTYARRYALQAITGIAPTDDDGEAATRPTPPKESTPRSVAKTEPPTEAVEAELRAMLEGANDVDALAMAAKAVHTAKRDGKLSDAARKRLVVVYEGKIAAMKGAA